MWSHSDGKAGFVFVSTVGDPMVDIKLFEHGVGAVKISSDLRRPLGDGGYFAVSCGIAGRWDNDNDEPRITHYGGGRGLTIQGSGENASSLKLSGRTIVPPSMRLTYFWLHGDPPGQIISGSVTDRHIRTQAQMTAEQGVERERAVMSVVETMSISDTAFT